MVDGTRPSLGTTYMVKDKADNQATRREAIQRVTKVFEHLQKCFLNISGSLNMRKLHATYITRSLKFSMISV